MEAKLKEITNEVARFYNLVDATGIQMTAELKTGMSEEEVIGIACKAMADIIGLRDFYVERLEESELRSHALPRSHYVFKLVTTTEAPAGADCTEEQYRRNDTAGGVAIVDIVEQRKELLTILVKNVSDVMSLRGIGGLEGDDYIQEALSEVVQQWRDHSRQGLDKLLPIIQDKLPIGAKVELRDNDEIVIRAA